MPAAADGRTSTHASNRSHVSVSCLVADDVAARDRGALGARQVQRDALSARRRPRRARCAPRRSARGQICRRAAQRTRSPGPHLAADRRAGDDQAVAVQRERAIDRQAEVAARRRRSSLLEQRRHDPVAQLGQALPGHERERHDRRVLRATCPSIRIRISSSTSRTRAVGHEIALGDDEDRPLDAEQMQDVEMLLGLRHHAVVGGDGEEHEVHAVRARQHVPDEALVTGHVDDARARRRRADRGRRSRDRSRCRAPSPP